MIRKIIKEQNEDKVLKIKEDILNLEKEIEKKREELKKLTGNK